ncbi:hypothetical protein [Halocatena marina]|uniref:Uncharacterized protein n=1 Tax=Halocatena marina TaxID=2934937 RepID=A0ABD5YV97_9EURY|nr:hypothetical protein [Halocatena marina]
MIVSLWTISFVFAFVAVGGSRLCSVVLERQESLGISYFWEGIQAGKRHVLAIETETFTIGFVSRLSVSIPGTNLITLSFALVGVYILIG